MPSPKHNNTIDASQAIPKTHPSIHTTKIMPAYHVYFTPKDSSLTKPLLTKINQFMETQLKHNHAKSYRLLQMTNKASFQDLPDYHLIVDYATDTDMQTASAHMKTTYTQEPHLSIMNMTGTFKVAYSKDQTSNH